jgi:hypothetical protein
MDSIQKCSPPYGFKLGDLVYIEPSLAQDMFVIADISWDIENGWIARLIKVGGKVDIKGWMPLTLLKQFGQKMSKTNQTNSDII